MHKILLLLLVLLLGACSQCDTVLEDPSSGKMTLVDAGILAHVSDAGRSVSQDGGFTYFVDGGSVSFDDTDSGFLETTDGGLQNVPRDSGEPQIIDSGATEMHHSDNDAGTNLNVSYDAGIALELDGGFFWADLPDASAHFVDCLGVVGGDAVEDNCGSCDNDSTNDCTQDCALVWGGDAVEDNCGFCDNDPANDCIQDCAGVWGGEAVENCEGDCGGPTCLVGDLSLTSADVWLVDSCVQIDVSASLRNGMQWPTGTIVLQATIPHGALYEDSNCSTVKNSNQAFLQSNDEASLYWKSQGDVGQVTVRISADGFEPAETVFFLHDEDFRSDERADKALIIYNTNDPDAFEIAEYYRAARNMDVTRLCGVAFPRGNFSNASQFAESRKQVVEDCFCGLTTSLVEDCGVAQLDEIVPLLPITHLVFIRGIPIRLYDTGWPDDYWEPSFPHHFNYYLANAGDPFCEGCTGYNALPYPLYNGYGSIIPAIDGLFATGIVEAITKERTFDLIDRTLASEALGFSGNFITENNLDLGYYLTSSFDAECTDYLTYEPFVWEAEPSSWPHERCRWGSTGSAANGSLAGMMPGYADTTIPIVVNAGYFEGATHRTGEDPINNHSGFRDYETMLRWRKHAEPCVPECEDMPTEEEQRACSETSLDYFKALNTECVGTAPGFMGHQIRSYPVQHYGFYPHGWHPYGNGASERTAPRTLVENLSAVDAPENRFLRFGDASPEAGGHETCGVVDCSERVAVNLRRDQTFSPALNMEDGVRKFVLTFKYRNQGAANATMMGRLQVNGLESWLQASTATLGEPELDLSQDHNQWTDASLEFVLSDDFSAETITQIRLVFWGGLANNIRGFFDLDQVQLSYGNETLLSESISEFDQPAPTTTDHGGFAADAIDRMGAIAFWGSSSHFYAGGFGGYFNEGLFWGSTLGESWYAWDGNVLRYGDPLYRAYGMRIYGDVTAPPFTNNVRTSALESLDVFYEPDIHEYGYNPILNTYDGSLFVDVINGTANHGSLSWQLSYCAGDNVVSCSEWNNWIEGRGAVRGYELSSEAIDAHLDGEVILRLRVWDSERPAEHLSTYQRFQFNEDWHEPEECIYDFDGNGVVDPNADPYYMLLWRTCVASNLDFDLDEDGDVDLEDYYAADVVEAADVYNNLCTPEYLSIYDFNEDGVVDGTTDLSSGDVAIAANNMLGLTTDTCFCDEVMVDPNISCVSGLYP